MSSSPFVNDRSLVGCHSVQKVTLLSCAPQHLPPPLQTSPSEKHKPPEPGLPSVGHVSEERAMSAEQRAWGQPRAAVGGRGCCLLNKPYSQGNYKSYKLLKNTLVYRMLQWGK